MAERLAYESGLVRSGKMKNSSFKVINSIITILLSVGILAGCSEPSYDGFSFPEKKQSELQPLPDDSYYISRDFSSVNPTAEETVKTVSSDDGLCVIEKKATYHDVKLDYENGSYRSIGRAYAEAVLKLYPDYPKIMDGYLFELVEGAFPNVKDYTDLENRVTGLKNSLDSNYQEELEGFAEIASGDFHGIKKDGKISVEEAYALNMVPDAIRATSCSVMTINGNKSASGHRIVARLLEWMPGSENQLYKFHCLTHFKNGDKSFTSVGFLGAFNALTAVNRNGLMIGELDVGSSYGLPFVYEGKTSFGYDLRYVMENYSSAKEAAEYLKSHDKYYTYNVNLFTADDKDAFCIEIALNPKEGQTIIRDSNTKLLDKLTWNDPDSLCIVNSFAAYGNADKITYDDSNLVRWKKYEKLFAQETERISLSHFKELMTSEKIKDSHVVSFRGDDLIHMVVMDFDTHRMQAVFGGKEDLDEIEWIDLGKMYK